MLFGGAAGIAGVAAIGKTIWSLGELGAQSLTTKASFESLMGPIGNATVLIEDMGRAADGTVSKLDLVRSANTALAGTTGQLSSELAAAMPKLVEAARAASMLNPAYGDAQFMLNSLVSGIKRGTPLLIDNTGIVLKVGEATEKYARSLGKSADALTSQERSIAILRATLEGTDTLIQQVGGNLDGVASDFVRADVAVQDMKTALGELFSPAVAAIARSIANAVSDVTGVLESTPYTRLAAEAKGYYDEIERITHMKVDPGEYLAGNKEVLLSEEMRVDMLKQANQQFTVAAGKLYEMNKAQIALASTTANTTRVTREYSTSVQNAEEWTNRLAGQASQAARELRGMRDGLLDVRMASSGLDTGSMKDEAAKLIDGNTFTGSYGSAVTTLAGTPMQWDEVNRASLNYANSVIFLNRQLEDHKITIGEYQYEIARLNSGITDLASSFNDTGGAVSDFEGKMKSLISQKLQPTFDLSGLTGGLLGGAGGDTFDEAYKRLAAVALRPEELQIHANDANWQDTFQKAGLTGLSPEDAQARAKELVEAYSKGLDFSLIDKEAIKDSIRQA
ncbi:MAG: hypothetical protein KDI12_23590, partial [Anaerolineae bacterium]|nr:hypothetical protein [Anaerolineae bacterium]